MRDQLLQQAPTIQEKTVLSFVSKPEEIDTSLLNEAILSYGTLVLPRVEENQLVLYYVSSLSQLQLSAWGILEPNPSLCVECPPHDLDIAFIPGVGFDKLGNRLGYGKGFYDRLLKQVSCRLIGLCFEEQLVSSIPTLPFDSPMTEVWSY